MANTIILIKGYARLTSAELKRFAKGDTLWGDDSNPVELKRWDATEAEAAKEELKKYRCSYDGGTVEEFALEYCECDEDGEFVEGSDYDLAEEEKAC